MVRRDVFTEQGDVMKKLVCNPLNLPYKYQFINMRGKKTVSREAADPTVCLYKGIYYLFASMTKGFLYSKDLVNWEFKECLELPYNDYAPDVREINGLLFFCASNKSKCDFYYSSDPLIIPFQKIEGSFPFWDPNMFQDDDGRLYFYWGSSNKEPLYGVELDPKTFKQIGEPKALVSHDPSHGFERRGEDHLPSKASSLRQKMIEAYLGKSPFIEGAYMTKHNKRYYLQYAAPGSQFNIYADGVYVSDHPLGPFTYQKNNPFSYKPGGFMAGAGHGSTFKDLNGNYYHVSTMRISVNHVFERRLGLFKTAFDEDGEMYCDQRYADWPFEIDKEHRMFEKPKYMLLSYGKDAFASSHTKGHEPKYITDENCRTWWQAKTNKNEWLVLDLKDEYQVNAVQINFADDRLNIEPPFYEPESEYSERFIDNRKHRTRYILEGSLDNYNYHVICDKSDCETDLPHDLIELDERLRYLRLTIIEVPFNANPCISGLRVFGKGFKNPPKQTKLKKHHFESPIDLYIEWEEVDDALGYDIIYGHQENKLYHSYMVYGKTKQYLGGINAGDDIYLRIDTFNENGITEGEVMKLR